MLACFWAIVVTVAIGIFHPQGEIKSLKAFVQCLDKGGRAVIQVAAACGSAGIIIGVITLTGLGLKLATVLVTIAGGNLLILLLLTAVVCIILGLGVPTHRGLPDRRHLGGSGSH